MSLTAALVAWPGMTALDVLGPHGVISGWPGVECRLVAAATEPVRTDQGLRILPDATYADIPAADVVLVGGGGDAYRPIADRDLLDWLAALAPHARAVCGVCTGAGVLAAAGLLEERRATTHWAFRPHLSALGADVVHERVVRDGRVWTAAGVSAGIDLALQLTAALIGESWAAGTELALEYDPHPPLGTGSPAMAPPELVTRLADAVYAPMFERSRRTHVPAP